MDASCLKAAGSCIQAATTQPEASKTCIPPGPWDQACVPAWRAETQAHARLRCLPGQWLPEPASLRCGKKGNGDARDASPDPQMASPQLLPFIWGLGHESRLQHVPTQPQDLPQNHESCCEAETYKRVRPSKPERESDVRLWPHNCCAGHIAEEGLLRPGSELRSCEQEMRSASMQDFRQMC